MQISCQWIFHLWISWFLSVIHQNFLIISCLRKYQECWSPVERSYFTRALNLHQGKWWVNCCSVLTWWYIKLYRFYCYFLAENFSSWAQVTGSRVRRCKGFPDELCFAIWSGTVSWGEFLDFIFFVLSSQKMSRWTWSLTMFECTLYSKYHFLILLGHLQFLFLSFSIDRKIWILLMIFNYRVRIFLSEVEIDIWELWNH